MLLLGVISFLQIIFIPGFIFLKLLRFKLQGIIQIMIYSFSLSLLINYSWPGNIRELKNVIRRSVLLAEEAINPEDIEFLSKNPLNSPETDNLTSIDETHILNLKEVEKNTIKKALKKTNGNKTKAAALLNISYVTLFKKIKDYSIS